MKKWKVAILIATIAVSGWLALTANDASFRITPEGIQKTSSSNTPVHIILSITILVAGVWLVCPVCRKSKVESKTTDNK